MELSTSFCDVISRNCLNREVIGYLYLIAILHHLTRAIHFSAPFVGNESCLVACQQLDGSLVEVVKMFVSHQKIVGLGHRCVVNSLVPQLRHGVNLLSVILNADAGMCQSIAFQGLAAFGLEHIYFVCVCSDRFASFFPSHDTTFEINTLIADVSQFLCSIG